MNLTAASASRPVRSFFATIGPVQRQVRELLSPPYVPEDADARPCAFCVPNPHLGELPRELDSRAWVHVADDSEDDPVLVIAGVFRGHAVYLALNLNERPAVSALQSAVSRNRLELLIATNEGLRAHHFRFAPNEAAYLQRGLAKHLALGMPMSPDWLQSFDSATASLPNLVAHVHPGVASCDEHTCIFLRSGDDSHLRSLRIALRRFLA